MQYHKLFTSKAVVLAALGLICGLCSSARGTDSSASDIKKAEIVKNAEKAWEPINRWLIEYEAVSTATNDDSLPVHRIVAFSDAGDLYHFTAHFPGYPWQTDPFAQALIIHNGMAEHQWPFGRMYSEAAIKKGSLIPGSVPMDVLWIICPPWSVGGYKFPLNYDDTPVLPWDAIKSNDFHLSSVHDKIAGEDCVIFEKEGCEQIWVSVNKACVMRRDYFDPKSHQLTRRVAVKALQEIAGNLWLPSEFVRQTFSSGESSLVHEARINIIRCVLNQQVPDTTFMAVHGPGFLKCDEKNQMTQIAPGGLDLLDNLVGYMTKYVHLPSKRVSQHHSFAFFMCGSILGLGAGSLLAITAKRNTDTKRV
jgi:hypothetical protein